MSEVQTSKKGSLSLKPAQPGKHCRNTIPGASPLLGVASRCPRDYPSLVDFSMICPGKATIEAPRNVLSPPVLLLETPAAALLSLSDRVRDAASSP